MSSRYFNEHWYWCEGDLVALCDVLRAEGAPMDDWAQAKTIGLTMVRRGELERAAVRFDELAAREPRFRRLAEYVCSLVAEVIDRLNVRRRELYPGSDDRPEGRGARKHIVEYLKAHIADTACTTQAALRQALAVVDARAARIADCTDADKRAQEFAHFTESGPFRTAKARAVSEGLVSGCEARRLERERAEQERERQRTQAAAEAEKRAREEADQDEFRRKLAAGEVPLPVRLPPRKSRGKALRARPRPVLRAWEPGGQPARVAAPGR